MNNTVISNKRLRMTIKSINCLFCDTEVVLIRKAQFSPDFGKSYSASFLVVLTTPTSWSIFIFHVFTLYLPSFSLHFSPFVIFFLTLWRFWQELLTIFSFSILRLQWVAGHSFLLAHELVSGLRCLFVCLFVVTPPLPRDGGTA